MKSVFRKIAPVIALMLMSVAMPVRAEEQPIDSARQAELWQQPDFVRAYYVVAEPGGALYSVFGHACLHMVCPAYNLDYFFSYESEDAASKFLSFLTGKLHMGMRAMTAEEYLDDFRDAQRGVKEYELLLPIEQKRELWRVLDEKAAEGMLLPYDYEARGCAYACVQILEEALGADQIQYGEWSPRFNRSRREITNDYIKHTYPWNLLVLNTVVGAEFDNVNSPEEKLVMPMEVAEVWQQAKVRGEYMLSREPHELLPSAQRHERPWFTPMMAALILLLLSILSWFTDKPYIDWLILGIVTLEGAVVTYLVVVSSLPCTGWNWLIIPYNILPAICWRWRRYWALPFAVVVGVWALCMLAWPFLLTDNALVVVAIAWMIVLIKTRYEKD